MSNLQEFVCSIYSDARVISNRSYGGSLSYCIISDSCCQIVAKRVVRGISVWMFSEEEAWEDAAKRLQPLAVNAFASQPEPGKESQSDLSLNLLENQLYRAALRSAVRDRPESTDSADHIHFPAP